VIKVDIIVPGYSHDAQASARLLKEALEKQGREVFIVDVFADERKKWLFRKTLLTTADHVAAVKTAEAEIRKIGGKIGTVYTHSYGVVAILAENLKAERYVLIVPPLETVKWKPIEKLFWFLPGFQELRSGAFQEAIFNRMTELSPRRLVLILSSLDGKYTLGDERVGYSGETIDRLIRTPIAIHIMTAKHGQFMRDPEMVERIIKA
jgi:hypothetical protein